MQRGRGVKRSYSKPADRNLPLLGFGGGVRGLLSREARPGPVTRILQTPVVWGRFPGIGAWTWEGRAIPAFKLQEDSRRFHSIHNLHLISPIPSPSPLAEGWSSLGTRARGRTKQRVMPSTLRCRAARDTTALQKSDDAQSIAQRRPQRGRREQSGGT